eukprot:3101145-Pleurochrysis_carterae.AAC.2
MLRACACMYACACVRVCAPHFSASSSSPAPRYRSPVSPSMLKGRAKSTVTRLSAAKRVASTGCPPPAAAVSFGGAASVPSACGDSGINGATGAPASAKAKALRPTPSLPLTASDVASLAAVACGVTSSLLDEEGRPAAPI